MATVVRLAPGTDTVMRVTVNDSALLGKLRPGRYVVAVAAGRSRSALGVVSTRRLTVTR